MSRHQGARANKLCRALTGFWDFLSRRFPAVRSIAIRAAFSVEIHGDLHQTKPKDSGIKIDVRLRIAGNRGYVMQSFNLCHNYLS